MSEVNAGFNLYQLARDTRRVAAMQQASLSPDPSVGLAPEPLIGSGEWWIGIRTNLTSIHGWIGDVEWGGMADMREWTVAPSDGAVSHLCWGDSRRYVPGLAVVMTHTEHPWKSHKQIFGDVSQIVLSVAIEESDERSSGIAPGPGGTGFDFARALGDVVHYLCFDEKRTAARAAKRLSQRLRAEVIGPLWTSHAWFVQVWERQPVDLATRVADIRNRVEGLGGSYDGGEEVAGSVWGPHGDVCLPQARRLDEDVPLGISVRGGIVEVPPLK